MPNAAKSFTVAQPTVKPEEHYQFLGGGARFSADGAYFSTHRDTDPALHKGVVTIYELAEPPREVMRLSTGYVDDRWVGFVTWRSKGHHFERMTKSDVREEWDPDKKARVRELPRDGEDEHPTLRLEVNGDLVVTHIADGKRLTFRELPSGALIVVDDAGCVSGAIDEGRSELRDGDGTVPTVAAVKVAHRPQLGFSTPPSTPP